MDAIKFLKSSQRGSDWYFFNDCNYKIRRHSNGFFSCVVGNREVRSRNPFTVVAELLEFIQIGEKK